MKRIEFLGSVIDKDAGVGAKIGKFGAIEAQGKSLNGACGSDGGPGDACIDVDEGYLGAVGAYSSYEVAGSAGAEKIDVSNVTSS